MPGFSLHSAFEIKQIIGTFRVELSSKMADTGRFEACLFSSWLVGGKLWETVSLKDFLILQAKHVK